MSRLEEISQAYDTEQNLAYIRTINRHIIASRNWKYARAQILANAG